MAAGRHETEVNKLTLDLGARYAAKQLDAMEAHITLLEQRLNECCKPAPIAPPATDPPHNE